MHRILATLAVLIGVSGLAASPAASRDLAACAQFAARDERRACVEREIGDGSFDRSDTAAVEKLLDTEPALVVEAVSRLEARTPHEPVGPRLLDLQGQALLALGRAEEAAEVYGRLLARDDGAERLSWYSKALERRWSVALDAGDGRMIRAARAFHAAGRADDAKRWLARGLSLGADPASAGELLALTAGSGTEVEAVPLMATDWFTPLPDVAIPLIDGGAVELESMRGKVVLLNFWATWCEPCVRELGHLQYLYESERDRGFEMIAVNTEEPLSVVVPYVKELGLTMPIGVYDLRLHAGFEVSQLPSVVIADRQGRIRGRWTGYDEDREGELTDVVRLLLEEETPTREIGRALTGAEPIETQWVREVFASISGMTLVPSGDQTRIVATQGESLPVFRTDGSTERRIEATSRAGLLRGSLPDEQGRYGLFGFRPGGTTVVVFALPESGFELLEAPSPVFSLEPFRTAEKGTELLVGTLAGLYRAEPHGTSMQPVGAFGLVSGISAGTDGFAVLQGGGTLSWIDASWKVSHAVETDPDAWSLVPERLAHGGFGVASPGVTVAVVGRFAAGAGPQIAVATDDAQLVLLDLDDGKTRGRWEIESVSGLAAEDLDGDGTDELIVASGSRLILFSAPHGPDRAESD